MSWLVTENRKHLRRGLYCSCKVLQGWRELAFPKVACVQGCAPRRVCTESRTARGRWFNSIISPNAPEVPVSASEVRQSSKQLQAHLLNKSRHQNCHSLAAYLKHEEGLMQPPDFILFYFIFFRRLIATCFYMIFSLLLDNVNSSAHIWPSSGSQKVILALSKGKICFPSLEKSF